MSANIPSAPLKVPALNVLTGGARITPDGTVNAPDVLLSLIFIVGIAQAHQFPEEVSSASSLPSLLPALYNTPDAPSR